MSNSGNTSDSGDELHDISSALLMIDNDEKKLLRALLAITLKSRSSRQWIIRKLGNQYLKIGEKLLKVMS
jgi:hypothetical protein